VVVSSYYTRSVVINMLCSVGDRLRRRRNCSVYLVLLEQRGGLAGCGGRDRYEAYGMQSAVIPYTARAIGQYTTWQRIWYAVPYCTVGTSTRHRMRIGGDELPLQPPLSMVTTCSMHCRGRDSVKAPVFSRCGKSVRAERTTNPTCKHSLPAPRDYKV
jgi:hypothetical protein